MGRWLGIDHGLRRIGVAVGATEERIACPVAVIAAKPHDAAIAKIRRLTVEYQVEGIVVGLPLNMDETEGPQAKLARQMAEQLADATHLPVRLWDERLSSFAADQALSGKFTRKQKKARQDAVAAASMLDDFLASCGPDGDPRR
ncbi:MAG TPA: Holliday junction resolvase RuvX [Phycisphaerae bacterium]|nr:Holliday junction resolvase RuvX [Phycisphaerae bacterium]